MRIFQYDKTFEGILTCVFDAYVRKAFPDRLLAEEERGGAQRELLSSMAREADCGTPLSAVMRQTGRFPLYVVGLVEVGERSGHLEEALQALSRYYEGRDRLDRQGDLEVCAEW